MRKFAGKVITKEIPFLDGTLTIKKLTAGAIKRISEATSEKNKKNKDDDAAAMDSLVVILNEAVLLEEGEAPIDRMLLEEFPIDSLNDLATEIMNFAGVGGTKAGNAEV